MVTIRVRLILAFFLIIGLGFYYLTDSIRNDVRPIYLETMEESMVDTANILAAFVERELLDQSNPTDELKKAFTIANERRFTAKIYDLVKTQINTRVYMIDDTGHVLFDSNNGLDEGADFSQWNDVHLTLQGEYGARSTRTDPEDPKTSVLHVAAPIHADGAITGVLTVAKPVDSVTLFLDAAEQKVHVAGFFVMVLVVLLGIALSVWITRPIESLTAYAIAVRDGKRVDLPKLGKSEIGTLGKAFESMRTTLENKQYVENYVQSLTHEIKSPLSAIQGAVELMNEDMPPKKRKQFLDNLRSESGRIQDLVDRMLLLAALENRRNLEDVESIAVRPLCEEIITSLQPVWAAKNLRIDLLPGEELHFDGEAFLVRQAVSNLLQNAVSFSPDGATIQVVYRKENKQVHIEILDEGPGIPDYALDKIFDRFYSLPRPESGKKSSGLGLALVKEVAELHGGKATVHPRPGEGVEATIAFPLTGSYKAS